MNSTILLIITGIINGPAIVALINKFLNRSKEKVDEEVTIGTEWQKYAIQAKKDKEEMERQFKSMTKEFEQLKGELWEKNEKIRVLEEKVDVLEKELERYRAMEKKVDEIKETAHVALDAVAEQVKQVINQPK